MDFIKSLISFASKNKLCSGRTTRLPYEVWHNSHFITMPTLDGVNALHNDSVIASKGGVFLTSNKNIQDNILSEGILPSGRVISAILKNKKIGTLGILGRYTPNNILD